MNKYEVVGQQIVDFLNDPIQKTTRLLSPVGTRFIVCGTSGSGKTLAIEFANNLLPTDEQIGESQNLALVRCPDRAMEIFADEELAFENSFHIGFNVLSAAMAKSLAARGLKVFWLNDGIPCWSSDYAYQTSGSSSA